MTKPKVLVTGASGLIGGLVLGTCPTGTSSAA